MLQSNIDSKEKNLLLFEIPNYERYLVHSLVHTFLAKSHGIVINLIIIYYIINDYVITMYMLDEDFELPHFNYRFSLVSFFCS